MKKILSLVLAVVMIMAMAIPAFAEAADEIAPCAAGCNGNHVYEEASRQVSYTHDETKHYKKVKVYYKCIYCPSTKYTESPTTEGYHTYQYDGVHADGKVYYKCTECKCYKTID